MFKRFAHVRFICIEPQSNKKKKKKQQQLSNSCPAYIVLEYSETLDRLVVKEQNSNHVHVGLRDSQIVNASPTPAVHNSPKLSTSSLQKQTSKRPRRKFTRRVIEKHNSNRIPVGLPASKRATRSTSALQASTPDHSTSLPKNEAIKRYAQKPTLDCSLIKRRKTNCVHADLKVSKINTQSAASPLQKLTRNKLWQKQPVDNPDNEEHNSPDSSMLADPKHSEINTMSLPLSPQKLIRKTLQQKPLIDNLVNEENRRSLSIHEDMQDTELKTISSTSPPQKLTKKTLQLKPPVDDLVKEDHNRSHLHKNLRKSQSGERAFSPLQVIKPEPANSLPQESERKGLLQTLDTEDTCDELATKNIFSPIEAHTDSLASKEKISGSGLERISNVMKDLMRVDKGSLASFSVDSSENLNRLSVQTSKMRLLFTKFPESLLLHRVQSNSGHVFYAFLVESKERVGKVVHFTVLNEDSTENVSKMLNVFAQFNPEYKKVKVIFMDVSFLHMAILKETFPTAQSLLSVYHTVRLIEKKVRKLSTFKANVELALKDVVFSTSAENRVGLSLMLKEVLDPDFHQFLQTHWFSSEMLWYMHVKKGLLSCSTYMDSLQVITHKIKSLFSKQPTLETRILYVLEYADGFNGKVIDNLNQSGLKSTHEMLKKVNKQIPVNLSVPAVVTPARSTSLPTSAMLLPKLAQMLPKKSILGLANLQTMQETPSPAQAQPEPLLVCSSPVSQRPLAAEPPPVLLQPCPVKPRPILPCPKPVLQSSALAQPPPILSFALPIMSQPLPAETMLPCKPEILQSSRPALVMAKSTNERSLLVPKTDSLLPKIEPLLSEPEPSVSELEQLISHTNPFVVTCSNCPPEEVSQDDDFILAVLQKLCTDVAYQLCLGEWKVVKKSTRVVEVESTRIIVRLLEDVQKVSKDCHTCDCYFNSRYRLPCRHILTVLHKNKRPVEEDMICHRWQKKYQQTQLTEDDILSRVRRSAVSQKEGDERFARMKSLSKELGNLLLQCEGAEFNERCSTLHTLINSWNRHQKQEDVQVGVLSNVGDLPFLWVKQEEP